MKYLFSLLFFTYSIPFLVAQSEAKSSAALFEDVNRLSNTATVMYIAAHPDDENTRMLSWLTHTKHVNTVYLSLTRGDGGQNLIGTEKGDLLGVLRTQELLEARKIDGASQFFSRAIDFGYSKTATETLQIWDEEAILGDVIWAIRKHQPDVIITRFDPESNGTTHGHHTASAQLALRAFDLAGDPNAYSGQLSYVDPWQPTRLFFNTSWWFYGSKEAFEKEDKHDLLSINVGDYYPTLGISNNEIAAMARSKHVCQGFGSALQRGTETEWLKLLKGNMPTNGDLLQGVTSRWEEVDQGQKIIDLFQELEETFDFQQPANNTPLLLKLLNQLKSLPNSSLKHKKIQETQQLLLDINGIYTEWITGEAYATNDETIETKIEITNRSPYVITILPNNPLIHKSTTIQPNQRLLNHLNYTIDHSTIQSPYWLKEPKQSVGIYTVPELTMRGMPENEPPIIDTITIKINGHSIHLPVALQHKKVSPTKGEIYEPFYVVPPVTVHFKEPVHLFSTNAPQNVDVVVTSFIDNANGLVQLDADLDWIIDKSKPFSIARKGESKHLSFQIIPPKSETMNQIRASVIVNEQPYFLAYDEVDYDHIPHQKVFRESIAKIGKINLIVPDKKVLYIQGSGDEIPAALRQVGLRVTEINTPIWSEVPMTEYDVVMVGIRAFNTLENTDLLAEHLSNFARQGGTVIVQYQTSRGLKTGQFAPHKLEIGRDRISEENAPLTMLDSTNHLLTSPNKITQVDFDGWVQERGLYFADSWSDDYTPILSGSDTGENEKKGILLITDVGEGKFIYTGLSFFRELPAGVPGAYRLMMNLINAE